MRDDDDKEKDTDLKEDDVPAEAVLEELLEENEEDDPLMAGDEVEEKPWE